MLKIVRIPSSLRTGPACFMALWWLGANMKPMPVSAMLAATCCGFSMMFAPRASSTSALPDFDDTDRPPCFAIRAPAAAATNMAAVASGGDFEAVRQRRFLDRQRVITGDRQRIGQAGEYTRALVIHGRELAVHDPAGADHAPAESLSDRLMAEAHAENRYLAG